MNTEETKKRMLEVLQETIDYYDSPEKYGYNNEAESCVYFDESKGVMCAVGRCAADPYEIARVGPPMYEFNEVSTVEGFLRSEYKGLPVKFWWHLQRLHDTCAKVQRPMVEVLGSDSIAISFHCEIMTMIEEHS